MTTTTTPMFSLPLRSSTHKVLGLAFDSMPTAAKLAFDAAAVVTIVVVHLSLSLSLSIVPK